MYTVLYVDATGVVHTEPFAKLVDANRARREWVVEHKTELDRIIIIWSSGPVQVL